MDVKHVAKLANLPLSEEEEKKFGTQLTAILDYVSELQKVDVSGVTPTNQVNGLINVSREDKIEPSLKLNQDYFKVKAIFDND